MRPTIYASAASCRHIIVLPLKCKSYLSTSRAISCTNHEKGSFQISSVVFWNCQMSQRATVPGQYFLIFFNFQPGGIPSGGALPPTVRWSFCLAGSSLPDIDSPASAAIWANCWVSNNKGDLPTLKLLCLHYPAHYLFCSWRGLLSWSRGMHWGQGPFLFCLHLHDHPHP